MWYLMAIVFPPIACLGVGRFWHFLLSVVLCLVAVGTVGVLFPLPLIHAWCVVKGALNTKAYAHGITINNYAR